MAKKVHTLQNKDMSTWEKNMLCNVHWSELDKLAGL